MRLGDLGMRLADLGMRLGDLGMRLADLVSHSLLLVHRHGAEGREEPGGHVAGGVAGTRGGHGTNACTAGRGKRVL